MTALGQSVATPRLGDVRGLERSDVEQSGWGQHEQSVRIMQAGIQIEFEPSQGGLAGRQVGLGRVAQIGRKLLPSVVRCVQVIPQAKVPIETPVPVLPSRRIQIVAMVAVIRVRAASVGRSLIIIHQRTRPSRACGRFCQCQLYWVIYSILRDPYFCVSDKACTRLGKTVNHSCFSIV